MRIKYLSAIASLLLLLCVFFLYSWIIRPVSGPEIPARETVPDIELSAARGGMVSLSGPPGKILLLSFVYASKNASLEAAKPSRSQINTVKSMALQYGSKGLIALLVDAKHLATGKAPDQDELTNLSYDWVLDSLPLLADNPEISAAARFGVSRLPTTLLVDSSGAISQRWDCPVSASQLASAIEALVGPPSQRQAGTLGKSSER